MTRPNRSDRAEPSASRVRARTRASLLDRSINIHLGQVITWFDRLWVGGGCRHASICVPCASLQVGTGGSVESACRAGLRT
jgi:hypothetical protein